jgi:5-methylcytosine-specific restriction enzyme subunit McrC
LRVVLRPKIPATNLYLLLDPHVPPEVVADSSAAEPGTEAIDFLASRLAAAMVSRAAAGLRRGYVERSDKQPFLQGRLDVAAQARETPAGRARFHTTRDEFSADLAVHRVPKAVAEALLSLPLIPADVRAALRAAIAGYADVPSAGIGPAMFDTLPTGRLSDDDRRLIDLCHLLVGGLRPGESGGDWNPPGFLIDLERVFERYVERGLRSEFPAGSLDVQREFVYHGPVPAGQPPLIGRPDFVIRSEGQVRCVLDAKWKALGGPPPAADVHQVLAYAGGLGCRDVRLVYPGRRYQEWRYELIERDTSLTVHELRVVGPRAKCGQCVFRLLKSVNQTLR